MSDTARANAHAGGPPESLLFSNSLLVRQMRVRCSDFGMIAALLAMSTMARPCGAQSPIAVIVGPNSPIVDLSMDQLRRLYLGSTTTLPNRQTVLLVEHPPERQAFYRATLGMTEDRVKRHWIQAVFAGDAAAPPREIDEADAVRRFVVEHPGAIAFLSESAVGKDAKIVTIDGRRPNDPGYTLR